MPRAPRCLAAAGRIVMVIGACASLSLPARSMGQEAAPVSREAGGEAPHEVVPIRFNFKEAPYDQVLDFLARETGLPVIYEADAPDARMTFISAADYTLAESITILNLSLARHNVRLRHEGDYLYLSTREEAFQNPEAAPIDGARPDAVLTVNIPLNNALASIVATQLTPLVSPPGQIIPVDSQNMLIVVEEAAQCRRIQEIVRQIDAVRPSGQTTEVFPLRQADATVLAESLRTLVGGREQTTFTDKNQNVVVIDDVTKPPMNITADVRTNSIVAVGPSHRMETVRQLITLLDVREDSGGELEMSTYSLRTITPAQASAHLTALFQGLEEAKRPTVLALEEIGKVTVVGAPRHLAQATALLSEVDPGVGDAGVEPDSLARTLVFKHMDAERAEQFAARLLSVRQNAILRRAPTPDGRGLVVVGPASDVDALASLLESLDTSSDQELGVRVIRIVKGEPAQVLARAEQFAVQTGLTGAERLHLSLDKESGTVTIVGPNETLDRFQAMLETAESAVVIDQETRTYDVSSTAPTVVCEQLDRLARRMLDPGDGRAFTPPTFEPLEELDQVVVRAEPAQFKVIEELVSMLDVEQPGARQFRVVEVHAGDPADIVAKASRLYDVQSAGLDVDQAGPVHAEIDAPSASVILSGSAGGIQMMADLMAQVQRLVPPQRTTRVIEVQHVDAADIVQPLQDLLSRADSIDPSRQVPEPGISVIDRTNSLLVTAEDAQHAMIADFVTRLDQLEPTQLPPLKLLQLRTADANAIAQMLTEQYDKRPQADRAARPVEVRSDAATNTLIVSAHEELFGEIRGFVEDLNKERAEGPERVTELFPLKVAKAEAVAAAMDKLYPEPPMPLDRRGSPLPWLREEKEVTVSAEASSNSLIIDAPAERMESLRELAAELDRVGLPPVSQLRTYRITGADLDAVTSTLQGMARQGILAAPPQPGMQAAEVIIASEPMSSTLIVAGDELTFERVEQVLEDIGEVPVERGMRIVPIANAPAADVRERALAIYGAQVAQIPDAGSVDVTIDEASNSLEIVADSEAMARFMSVIEELQRQAGPAREARLIELRFAKVGDVIEILRELVAASESLRLQGGPMPVFEPIETTNSLLVAAQPVQFAIIEQLVRGLDNRQSADRPPLRILRLRSTDAADLAPVLQEAFDRRSVEERAKEPVEIRADAATNTLIVSAHDTLMGEVETIVGQLNETALSDEDREIRIFPLKFAQAEELATTIDEMYPEPPMPHDARGRPMPQLQRGKEVVVRADRGTNSLIVDAPAKRLIGFEQIVQSLDQQNPTENVELRTYRIERADLESVASTLRSLASEGALGQVGRAPVTVSVEAMSRSMVVSGPSEIFAQVEQVLSRLDAAPDSPVVAFRFYALEHARAERLEPLITNLLSTRLHEQQIAGELVAPDVAALLEVAADRASNTLIISAPDSLQQLARELIEALDTEAAQIGRSVVRVVPLTYADASGAAETLSQAVQGMEMPSGTPPTILAAVGSNALLLMGAEADLAKVESLIEPLDARPMDAAAQAVATFQLVHADAAALAPIVQNLLDEQRQTNPALLRERLRYARNAPELLDPPSVVVEADSRTNSLIVSAPTETVDLARTLIEHLDQPADDTSRTTATYTPARAGAEDLAEAVRRVAASAFEPSRVALEIVAEPRSGSIVVIGVESQVNEALRLLADFDDRAVAAPAAEVQAFNLEHADAGVLAQTLQSVLDDRARWPEALRRAEQAGLAVARPTVNADSKTNRLFVGAPTALMPMARQLIEALDVASATGAVDVHVFRLTMGEAASAAEALRTAMSAGAEPGSPAPTIAPEPASNAVLVAGTPEQLNRAAQLIESLDATVEPEGIGVRTMYLEHARAEVIAPVIEQILTRDSMMDTVPYWARWQFMQAGTGDDGIEVRVAAEPRLNAIVVSAPRGLLDVAEGLVAQLDVPRDGEGAAVRLVRVIPLANADAQELASSLEAMFDEEDGAERPPVIRVDSASNALIVRATDAQMQAVERLAGELDSATLTSSRQLRTIPVDRSRADAALMAQTLRRLLEQQRGVKVEVISAEQLLEQPPEQDEQDEEEGSEGGQLPYVPDPSRSIGPPMLFEHVSTLFAAIGVQPVESPEPTLTIAVDPSTNSIIVIGSPRLTDRVAALAVELESQLPPEPTKVRLVELPAGWTRPPSSKFSNRRSDRSGRPGRPIRAGSRDASAPRSIPEAIRSSCGRTTVTSSRCASSSPRSSVRVVPSA